VSGVFEKRFTLLKSVNHFLKFTKQFLSNRNHFSVDYYFRPYQTPKNNEIIFQKSFYAETNGALVLFLFDSTIYKICLEFITRFNQLGWAWLGVALGWGIGGRLSSTPNT
jgi:hypothetical protein